MADVSKLILNGQTYNIKDTSARTSIAHLNNEVGDINSDIDNLNESVNDIDGDVSGLSGRVSTNETNIANNTERINNLNDNYNVQGVAINNINSRLNNDESRINDLEDNYSGFDENLTNLREDVNNNTSDIAGLSSRVDEFSRLEEGSTTGDAELINARIAYSGAVYNTAGAAIRGQVRNLNKDMNDNILGMNNFWTNNFVKKTYSPSTGQEITPTDGTQFVSNLSYIGTGNTFFYECASGYLCYVVYYNNNDDSSYHSRINGQSGNHWHIAVADYVRLILVKSDYSQINFDDASNLNAYIYNMSLNRIGYIMGGTDINNGVSVDLENKIITFPSYAVIVYGNTRIDISNRTFDFTSYNPDFGCIYYDYVTKDFTILDAGRPSKYFESKHLIYIGLVWLTGRYIELNVKPYYFVGGVRRTIDDSRFISIHTNIVNGRMAVLGDSISTFTGVSETGSEYWGSFYPNGDVTSVDDMWWEKVRKGLNFSTCSVSAISRSAYKPNSDPKIIYSGADSRITRLGQYGSPKWVFIEMGLNDGFASLSSLGENPYTNDISTLESNHSYLYSACGETIRKVQNAYPDAKIIVLIPKNLITGLDGTYPMERQVKFCDAMKEMAEEMGVYKIIDLRKCGINVSNAVNYTANNASDGIHPNKSGMQLIADYIIQEMIGF